LCSPIYSLSFFPREKGKYKQPTEYFEHRKLVEIENERLRIEKERLDVETQRLKVEQQRLEVDRQRLLIDQKNHQLYMTKLNRTLTQMGIHVADAPTTDAVNTATLS
jgi:ABC-type phosphate transport system auxiliary subunit